MKNMRVFFIPAALLFLPVSVFVFFCGSGKSPLTVIPQIVATIPHDSTAFTQGLFFDGNRLYESDGLYGKSSLCIRDAQNGAPIKNITLDPRYFGEGCAIMEQKIVQITWREQTALTYSIADLSPGSSLVYCGEGWGLTSDGKFFYMSDGSDTLTVRNKNFTIVRKIPVTSGGKPVKKLNELEYVNGTIFANVWYSDSILEINPKTGRVEGIVDCSELVKKEQPGSSDCVLNGIAYNPSSGRFYLTGKKWKNIFVVEIPSVTN
jgi:glutaminyl-peptide cyclotransferase